MSDPNEDFDAIVAASQHVNPQHVGYRSEELELDVLPDTPEGWVDKLKNIDYKDHLGAIAAVGGAALALGVGYYELKKHGKSIKIGFADRHNEKRGIVSIVEKTESGGLAVGAATTKAALKALGKTKDIFAMEDGSVAYPLEREDDGEKASSRARKVAGWLVEIYQSRSKRDE